MASRVFHYTTTASTNLVPIPNSGNAAAITGYEMTNTAATAMWVKFYWGNANSFSSSKDTPTVGTDIPGLTVALAAGTSTAPARSALSWTETSAPKGNGTLFMAVTGGQPDSDSSNAASGAVITVTYW